MCGCILGWRSVAYHNLVTVTLNLTSDLVSRNCCISPIFFEIGIPNLVCKCILGYLSVTNHFWVTVTLTSDLIFKNYCVQSISPILFDVGIPNLGWWFLLGWRSGAYHFESFWPWHWPLASFLVFSCYITAIFPQMCLILDQFLWGHSSRVCDISCFALMCEDSLSSPVLELTLNAPIATKVICFSHLLKCLRSLYCKQCGPRSDCSYWSSLFWVHAVCFYT